MKDFSGNNLSRKVNKTLLVVNSVVLVLAVAVLIFSIVWLGTQAALSDSLVIWIAMALVIAVSVGNVTMLWKRLKQQKK